MKKWQQNRTIQSYRKKKHNFKIVSPLENFIWVRFFWVNGGLLCSNSVFRTIIEDALARQFSPRWAFIRDMNHSLRLSGCPHANKLMHFSLKCTLRACTVSLMLRDLFVTWINVLAITDHWQKLHYITMHACVRDFDCGGTEQVHLCSWCNYRHFAISRQVSIVSGTLKITAFIMTEFNTKSN